MKRIRVGIIGQGRSGYDIHGHSLQLVNDQFEIKAVADPLPERRAEAERTLSCDSYEDYRRLFDRDDIDLIVNSTPSHLHVPVTVEILEAGFNALCEKPLARYVKEVDMLVAKARETGKVLAVFQQSRFAPYFQKVRELIDSGVLGRIVMIKIAFNGYARRWDWQTLQECYGGNLLNTGPHPLDQALQLFGDGEEPSVFCLMDRVNTYGDAEDHVKLILHGKSSPTVDLEISSCTSYSPHVYQVYGSRGSLAGTMTHLDWKYFDEKDAPPQKLIREPLPGRAYCREDLPWQTGSWDIPEEESNLFDTIATRFYRNLYSFLTEGVDPEVTLDQVRRQIAVIEECHRQNPMN